MSVIPYEVKYYQTTDGRIPFQEYLNGLTDAVAKRKINARIARIASGNLGDHEFYGDVGEFRDFSGPGYRLYFGKDGKRLIIMLCAGVKASQDQDWKNARSNWEDYRRRRNGAGG